jgi:chromosome segregation ATPase
MADPLSIATGVLSILGVCISVTTQLKTFYGNIKFVDEAIGGLENDVASLQRTLEAVRDTLDQADAHTYTQQTGHLGSHWRNVQQALDTGQKTLSKLETTLKEINKEVTVLNASRKQLRLQGASSRIAAYRSQIQCSRDVLNTSLQSFI